jgi:hypothetical protein
MKEFYVFVFQIEDLQSWARIQPVVNQVELHPLLAQRKLVGVCLRKVTGSTPGPDIKSRLSSILLHGFWPRQQATQSCIGCFVPQTLAVYQKQKGCFDKVCGNHTGSPGNKWVTFICL